MHLSQQSLIAVKGHPSIPQKTTVASIAHMDFFQIFEEVHLLTPQSPSGVQERVLREKFEKIYSAA